MPKNRIIINRTIEIAPPRPPKPPDPPAPRPYNRYESRKETEPESGIIWKLFWIVIIGFMLYGMLFDKKATTSPESDGEGTTRTCREYMDVGSGGVTWEKRD